MTEISRRSFNLLAGASLTTLSTPLFAPSVLGQAKPRLIVVGGGPGGATVARYVAKDSAGAIDVTLIEPLKNFTTCFFSNLYVGGFRDLKSLRHNYDNVRKGGVNVVPVMASSIDRDKKQVWLAGGSRVSYHRIGGQSRFVRPTGDRARNRSQVGFGPWLFRSRRANHAACLEAGRTNRIIGKEAQFAQGRGPHRDGSSAKPVPLPTRALRAG